MTLFCFAPGGGGSYAQLSQPANAARQILAPAAIALFFSRNYAATAVVFGALALVHSSYALFMLVPLVVLAYREWRMYLAAAVPVVMVLHMPVGYTEMYAQRLDALAALNVREAREGDDVRAGSVLLAPAGKHLSFVRERGVVRAHLDDRPADSQHRPSVDVLFQSAAETFGSRVLGVVMTGMGSDGLLGAGHIKARGGRVVTEAESSCVVYGMPRVIVEASLSDRSATLHGMAGAIMEMI